MSLTLKKKRHTLLLRDENRFQIQPLRRTYVKYFSKNRDLLNNFVTVIVEITRLLAVMISLNVIKYHRLKSVFSVTHWGLFFIGI